GFPSVRTAVSVLLCSIAPCGQKCCACTVPVAVGPPSRPQPRAAESRDRPRYSTCVWKAREESHTKIECYARESSDRSHNHRVVIAARCVVDRLSRSPPLAVRSASRGLTL